MSDLEWLDIFSDNLRDIMDEQDISSRELAKRTGIDESTISRYLSGERYPSAKNLCNISYVLDVDMEELVCNYELID